MPFFLGATDLTFDILKPCFFLGDAENLALSFVHNLILILNSSFAFFSSAVCHEGLA